jgi:hypothetical protein
MRLMTPSSPTPLANNYAVLPVDRTIGGVILACSLDHFTMLQVVVQSYSITTTITRLVDNAVWTITGVYGPQDKANKMAFLQELRLIRQSTQANWLLMVDFNLIYWATDKNNNHVNHRLISSFRATLDALEVKELQLHGRRLTWSSDTANPTQSKIDHVLASKDWELADQNCYLQALGSSMLDHCPILPTCNRFQRRYK